MLARRCICICMVDTARTDTIDGSWMNGTLLSSWPCGQHCTVVYQMHSDIYGSTAHADAYMHASSPNDCHGNSAYMHASSLTTVTENNNMRQICIEDCFSLATNKMNNIFGHVFFSKRTGLALARRITICGQSVLIPVKKKQHFTPLIICLEQL